MENEKKEIRENEMEFVITEGKVLEPGTDKGKIMKDVQEQKQTDKELLESIDKKLDILLAAQSIS